MAIGLNAPLNTVRGREPGGALRVEGEHMSADECKQHDCNQKSLCAPQNAPNQSTLKFFAIFFAIIFLISFETLISNMRCIWLNCKMLINSNIFVDLAIIFSASLKQ